jgi:protein tyrosine phosphatase (PTP) superfamily phosphohydrolase (DUF442 family)
MRLAAAVWFTAALLSLSTAPALGEAREPPIPSDAIRQPAERRFQESGIPRFAEIEPGLARGGQPKERGLRFLRERGYRTVISFRPNSPERKDLEAMGIRYIEIPMRSSPFGAATPTKEDVRRFLSAVSDSTLRPIFIHCRRGKDRTGAMAAIYRIEACGWTNEEAIREMKAFGFNGLYRNLKRYVRTYERGSAAVSPAAVGRGAANPRAVSNAVVGTAAN